MTEPLDIDDTTIAVWQERDNLHICLSRKSDDKTLVEWRDEEAYDALNDGLLNGREAILGSLERNVRQYGLLHRSAFEYWESTK